MSVFSVFSSGKNNEIQTPQEYYYKHSKFIAFFKFLFIGILLLYILYTLSVNGSMLTSENVKRLIKIVKFDTEKAINDGNHFYYDNYNENIGTLIDNDLAVLNYNGLTVYDIRGLKLLHSDFTFENPLMKKCGNNVVIYELGGYELKEFNSYTNINNFKFDYPIYDVDTNINGDKAIISSRKSYRSGFVAYDKYSREIFAKYYDDEIVRVVALNSDATKIYSAAVDVSSGGYVVTVTEHQRLKGEEYSERVFAVLKDEYPVDMKCLENGELLLITDSSYKSYGSDGKMLATISFKNGNVSDFIFGDNYVILSYRLSLITGGTKAEVYGKDGICVFSKDYQNGILDKCIYNGMLFVLTNDKLDIVDLATGSEKEVDVKNEASSIVHGDDYLLLFASDNAEIYLYEEINQ